MSQLNQSLEPLKAPLALGKRRGYEEIRVIDGVNYLLQFAIKKTGHAYEVYTFKIELSKMDIFEEHAEERCQIFATIDQAGEHLQSAGADIRKFKAIKRVLPF